MTQCWMTLVATAEHMNNKKTKARYLCVSKLSSLVILLLLLSAINAVEASQFRMQSLKQLIEQAHIIIYGTVESVTDGISSNGTPFTEITVRMNASVTDNIGMLPKYSFRQFGFINPRKKSGEPSLFAIEPQGLPRWYQGETVIAFLYSPDLKTGFQATVGQEQGKILVVEGKLQADITMTSLLDNVSMDSTKLTLNDSAAFDSRGSVDAEVFMRMIRRFVSKRGAKEGRQGKL